MFSFQAYRFITKMSCKQECPCRVKSNSLLAKVKNDTRSGKGDRPLSVFFSQIFDFVVLWLGRAINAPFNAGTTHPKTKGE